MGDTHVQALRSVSLQIAAGEFVAIMGASGSGKSTFMNLLGCLDSPSSGDYLLAGEQVSSMSGDALAAIRNQRIGFVFQQFNLVPYLDALANVLLPLTFSARLRHQVGGAAAARIRGLELLNQYTSQPPREVVYPDCRQISIVS